MVSRMRCVRMNPAPARRRLRHFRRSQKPQKCPRLVFRSYPRTFHLSFLRIDAVSSERTHSKYHSPVTKVSHVKSPLFPAWRSCLRIIEVGRKTATRDIYSSLIRINSETGRAACARAGWGASRPCIVTETKGRFIPPFFTCKLERSNGADGRT